MQASKLPVEDLLALKPSQYRLLLCQLAVYSVLSSVCGGEGYYS